MKNNNIDTGSLTFQHNRVDINTTVVEYYNPCNIIIDHFCRDISEYIKSCIINKQWNLDIVKEYLSRYDMKKNDIQIMYARIIFPSYFLDKLEEYIIGEKIEKILSIENIIPKYSEAIYQISYWFIEMYDIEPINWIIKKDSKY